MRRLVLLMFLFALAAFGGPCDGVTRTNNGIGVSCLVAGEFAVITVNTSLPTANAVRVTVEVNGHRKIAVWDVVPPWPTAITRLIKTGGGAVDVVQVEELGTINSGGWTK